MYSLGSIPSCPAEEMFLCRLLNKDSIEANGNEGTIKYVEEALASRREITRSLLTALEDSINVQRAKTEHVARALDGNLSSEGQKVKLQIYILILISCSWVLFVSNNGCFKHKHVTNF